MTPEQVMEAEGWTEEEYDEYISALYDIYGW